MSHFRQHRRAFTLLEVVIAMGLFLMASAAIMESLVATRHMVSLGAARDQVELDATSVIRTMAGDLATSGWEFVDPTDTTTYAGVTRAVDRTLRYYPMVQVPSSPGGSNADGFNTRLPWTRLLTAYEQVPDLPTSLPGNVGDDLVADLPEVDWQRSFHARSTHLVFLRSAVGSWRSNQVPGSATDESVFNGMTDARYQAIPPRQGQRPALNFSTDSNGVQTGWQDWAGSDEHARLGVLRVSGFFEAAPGSGVWSEFFPNQPYGATLDAGWYDWTDTEEAPLKPTWETMRLPNPSSVSDVAMRRSFMTAPERLREFMYVVVPSPSTLGLGRLVRAYRVPGGATIPAGTEPGQRISVNRDDSGAFATEDCAMVVDSVLSDDVVRVVFDTVRTVAAGPTGNVDALGINQVRVRLYLARRQLTNPDLIIYRVVETTLGMRARSSGGDMLRISGTLGSTPVGIDR